MSFCCTCSGPEVARLGREPMQGPLLVEGDIEVLDALVAVCRCGHPQHRVGLNGTMRHEQRTRARPCVLVTARQSEGTYSPGDTPPEAGGALKWGCTCSLDSFDSLSRVLQ